MSLRVRYYQLAVVAVGGTLCILGSHFHATTAIVLGAVVGFGGFIALCSE